MEICREFFVFESVTGNSIHNRIIKLNDFFHTVFILWNGPPMHKCTESLEASLNRRFHGKNYHLTQFSSQNKLKMYKVSKIIDKIHKDSGRLQFLNKWKSIKKDDKIWCCAFINKYWYILIKKLIKTYLLSI